jgi:hypothetical protein
LRELFSVERILSARGFQIESEGSADDTLLRTNYWTVQDLDQMFSVFENSQTRADLLMTVSDTAHVPASAAVRDLASRGEFCRDRQRYSSTFEWFVGELLIRKFQAFSSSFGVTVNNVIRNSDGGAAGDFDVLSVLGDMSLLYLECKTGKCHLSSILRTIERGIALHSVASVILLDAGLQKATLLQQLRGQSHPRFGNAARLATIQTRGLEDSQIFEWCDCFFVSPTSANGDVENQLRTVMRILAAYRSSIFEEIRPRPQEYGVMGYDYWEDQLS